MADDTKLVAVAAQWAMDYASLALQLQTIVEEADQIHQMGAEDPVWDDEGLSVLEEAVGELNLAAGRILGGMLILALGPDDS